MAEAVELIRRNAFVNPFDIRDYGVDGLEIVAVVVTQESQPRLRHQCLGTRLNRFTPSTDRYQKHTLRRGRRELC
jgi:hypothetical protein